MYTVLNRHYFIFSHVKQQEWLQRKLKNTFDTLDQASNNWVQYTFFLLPSSSEWKKEPCLLLETHTRPIVNHQKSV